MSLEVALVIRGDAKGAKGALEETASGVKSLKDAADGTATKLKDVAGGLDETARQAGPAATGLGDVGAAAESAGGKFKGFGALAIGAIGGIAGALASAGLEALFSAALGAVVGYFDQVTNSSANIKADIDAHKALIADIKGLWDQANGAASDYGLTSKAGLQFEAQQNISRFRGDFASAAGRLSDDGIFTGGSGGVAPNTRAPFQVALDAFIADLRAGTPDVIAFREEVASIANAFPPDSQQASLAARIIGNTQEAAEVQSKLAAAVDLYKALGGDAGAAATALGASAAKMVETGNAAGGALPNLREYEAILSRLGGGGTPSPSDPIGKGGRYDLNGNQVMFASGGYTGHGPADQVAGFVHGREYVFDAESTARIGVGNLEAMRRGVRGYASGGFVGSAVSSFGGSLTNTVLDRVFSGLSEDAQFLRGALGDFTQALVGTLNPISAFAQTLSSVSQSYLNSALGAVGSAVGNLLMGGGGSFIGGTPGAPPLQLGYQVGVLHGGWDGASAMPTRSVPAAMFLGAPRLHSGLAADEFPAILQTGEEVIPRGGRARSGAVVNTHNWFISTPSPRAFAESRATLARTAARLMGRVGRYT